MIFATVGFVTYELPLSPTEEVSPFTVPPSMQRYLGEEEDHIPSNRELVTVTVKHSRHHSCRLGVWTAARARNGATGMYMITEFVSAPMQINVVSDALAVGPIDLR